MSAAELLLLALTGVLAGICNAVVGGGTLFTFPVVLAAGLPPVIANATCTVALWPGAIASAYAYRGELAQTRAKLWLRVAGAIAGGLVGAVLLLVSGDAVFFTLVPWLLAAATLLFTFAKPIVSRVFRHAPGTRHGNLLRVLEFLAAIYGGYFGAAIGILLLAAMALSGEHDAQRANAERNYIVCFINGIAVVIFVLMGVVRWPVALTVGVGSVAGGFIGARLARRIPGQVLRHIVSAAGAVFALYYFVRVYG